MLPILPGFSLDDSGDDGICCARDKVSSAGASMEFCSCKEQGLETLKASCFRRGPLYF